MRNKGQQIVRFVVVALIATPLMAGGCYEKRIPKTTLTNPYGRQMTIAIAPVLNYSGNPDLDPVKVTDILYSEMQQVDGFSVVPVNRMLAQMVRDNIVMIETPQQALKLASALGADAIVVAAITEYNPFYPPIVGIAAQIYGLEQEAAGPTMKIDPVAMERQATPLKVSVDIAPQFWPKNQVQRIYNSRDKAMAHLVEEFAEDRGTAGSPYKWEVYLRSQEYYLRFVSFKLIEELLDKELRRINPGIVSDHNVAKECN